MWESRRKVEREVRERRTGGRNTLLWMEAREIGEITQQYNVQYFAMAKALGVRNQGKGKGVRSARCEGREVWTPAPPSPHVPPPSANETIDNPQSIHVLVDVKGKMGGRGTRDGRGESGRRRERNGGKLRNNGQYFVIEKKKG